ncbi:MAG TPA: HD domain-containing protein [Lactobacillaceae bacterium]|jgi:3'-5' exoribonuclease
MKNLREFTENETVQTFALIKSADLRMTKTGKPYLSFVFTDRSGDLPGNLWDATDKQTQELTAGTVVFIDALRTSYKDQPQLNLNAVRLPNEGEPNDPADFTQHGPMKTADMQSEVNDLLLAIINPTWNRLVRKLFSQYHEAFFKHPAAKANHHAFAGGLGFHTLSIARLARSVAKQYPQVNEELLLAGALLHDLGKVIELSGPVGTQYTLAGNLIGHIILIDEQIVLAARELNFDLQSEDMILLRHVVLAHHGLLEYGSPVRPQVMEAEVLHQLDNIDAGIQMMTSALAPTDAGQFSERVFGLDGRKFYQPESAAQQTTPDSSRLF